MSRLKLDMFDLAQMVDDCAILSVAKRGSGKSILCRDLMYHLRKIPCGVVIAPTDKLSGFYKKFFPDLYTHYELSQGLLDKILYRQTIMIDKLKKKKDQGQVIDPRTLLLMDDCLAQGDKWKKMPGVKEIMMNGRHYYITYILTMQYGVGIGPELRGNFDYVFLLKEDGVSAVRKLHEHYAGIFPDKKTFEIVFRKCTNNHQCMVIDNRKPADSISEKVFYFKATFDRHFSFGSREFRDMHQEYYDPQYLKRITKEAVKPVRRGPDIDVLLRH